MRYGDHFRTEMHREARVAGEDRRDSVELRLRCDPRSACRTAGRPRRSLLVDRMGALPGRHRLRDDVVTVDDGEALAAKERRPVGDEFFAAVVEDSSECVVVCPRRVRVQRQVGETDAAAGRSTRWSSCTNRSLSGSLTQMSPAASRQTIASNEPSGKSSARASPLTILTRSDMLALLRSVGVPDGSVRG